MIEYLIGSAIILIILIIIAYAYWKHKPTFMRENAMSYIYGTVNPQSNSADGNVTYLGSYNTQDLCESACAASPNCKGYTWCDSTNGSYANQCYGLANLGAKTPQANIFSGYVTNESFKPLAAFSNTLQRRLGMGGAGDTGAKQNFRSGDVASGTMYAGYYNPAALPI